MATVSTVSKPGYIYDANTDTWYPIGVGSHTHSDAIPASANVFAGKNAIINGAFNVWQRGTSFSLAASTAYTSGFTADRWVTQTNANQACTISRQVTNDTTNLPFIQYCLRYQRNSGQTGTAGLYFVQNFESAISIPFAGKTVTFSFYARAGANYSATSGILATALYSGTGTDQNSFVSYTGVATVANINATLTTTWQRFTCTGAVAANATELNTTFVFNPTGTASTNDYFEITGVQVEVGSTATPFQTASGTIQGELALCRYYYRRTTADATSLYQPMTGTGFAALTTAISYPVLFDTPMRTTPTSIEYSNLRNSDGLNAPAVNAITLSGVVTNQNALYVQATTTGATQFRPYGLQANNSASGYLGWSAEL